MLFHYITVDTKESRGWLPEGWSVELDEKKTYAKPDKELSDRDSPAPWYDQKS